MIARAGARRPVRPSRRPAGLLAGVEVSAKRVERTAAADGAAAAAGRARTLVPLPAAPLPDMLYTAIDGTGVPVIGSETEGGPDKAADGRAAPARSNWPACSPRPP